MKGMRAALLVSILVATAGCAHTSTSFQSGAAAGSRTTTVHGGRVVVHGHSDAFAAFMLAGMLVFAAADYNPETYYSRGPSIIDGFRGSLPAPLDESRRISEQDCTRPLDETSGNLRCR